MTDRRPALLLLLAVGLAACLGDPERGNPFDPRSENFRDAGAVAGTVTAFYPPYEGVDGARVHLRPSGGGPERVAPAGADGRFSLPDVPAGSYTLVAEADGYATVTDTVKVAVGRLAEVTLRIDGLPRVAAQTMRTERINRFWPDPLVRLVVEAQVEDPDGVGDLATVALTVPSLSFRDTLVAVTGVPGRFARVFPEDALPVGLQELLGRNFFIEVSDRAGQTVRGPDTHVVRVVEGFPQPVSPLAGATVSATPMLRWEPLALPYRFTWRVAVVLITPDGGTPVVTFNALPPEQTSVQVTTPLPGGALYWTVAAVDETGNLSRSVEADFRIEG